MLEIVEPFVEPLFQGNDWKAHVARCARICYGKESGDDEKTIKHLLSRCHLSPFRHQSVYAICNNRRDINNWLNYLKYYDNCPYIDIKDVNGVLFIATNGNFMLDIEHKDSQLYDFITANQVNPNEFECYEYAWDNMMRYTFIIDTQISTSRELNRVSPNNICEASTRYIEGKHIIVRPYWMDKDIADIINSGVYTVDDIGSVTDDYVKSCEYSFKTYDKLHSAGMKPQDARGVLPLDTFTKVAYTYSIKEWRKIIDLRYYGTTGQPHPNAKLITSMIIDCLVKEGYNFKDFI